MHSNNLLLVGASSALGLAFLSKSGRNHQTIFAHCNSNSRKLEELTRKLAPNSKIVQCDLATENGAKDLIENVLASGVEIDGIVFFAAPKLKVGRFHKLDWEADFAPHIAVQVRTSFLVLKTFLPVMAKRKHGKVVFVLSGVLEGKPPGGMPEYVTVKYAQLGLMKAAATEYAGRNICINAVSPSMMETPFLDAIPSLMIEMNAVSHPRGVNALPDDIVPILSFLLSDEARFITGQNIVATGGA